MDEKKIYIGGGALIAVLVLIAMFTTGGRSSERENQRALAAQLAPVNDAVAAIESRVADIESSVETIAAQVAEGVSAQDMADVQMQLDELTGQTAALSSQMDTLADGVAAASAAATAAAASAPLAAAVAAAPAEAAPVAEATPEPAVAADSTTPADGAALTVGMTAMMNDGALRVFVSRIDTEAGQALVMADGQMMTLTDGISRTIPSQDDFCRITLSDVAESSVQIAGVCGADLPPAEGLGAGETAMLEDGALRVFVSRVTEDSARLFINGDGVDLPAGGDVSAALGESVCTVSLDSVDRGLVQIGTACE